MWCNKNQVEVTTTTYWCSKCRTPVIRPKGEKEFCPLCNHRMKNLAPSIRPVFPAEVKFLELMTGRDLSFKSIWKGRVSYFVNGKGLRLGAAPILRADDKNLRNELLNKVFDTVFFNQEIKRFIRANREHLETITEEALGYIQSEVDAFNGNNIYVSFSGGKDSTVTSALVRQAYPNRKIMHIFGDTTLELNSTYDYVNRFKKDKNVEFHVARNNDQNFFEIAKEIGPPKRDGRWCCYMFKTGPVNRKMQELFRGEKALTFVGVRRSESSKRAKYNRTEESLEAKISNQRKCQPILYWSDLEVWLYVLANNLDFNEAYTHGYSRVGCYTCPNGTSHSELMSKIYNHTNFGKWTKQLCAFAEQCQLTDSPEHYVAKGGWKGRVGGLGTKAAYTVRLKSTSCTTEENGKTYELYKSITPAFYNLFAPFGLIIDGRKAIGEKLILCPSTKTPIVSIQPLNCRKIKIVTLNVKYAHKLHGRLAYQIIKWNACQKCLKCESLCAHGAITMNCKGYQIEENKCTKCQVCVNPKHLAGGCLMTKYLRTKKEAV